MKQFGFKITLVLVLYIFAIGCSASTGAGKDGPQVNDFETEADLNKFVPKDGLATELSREHVTHGSYSLLAEYPAGAKYPGLCWEVYRRDQCLNWSKYEVFKFDVFNASTQHVVLNIKFKSKPNYPKPAWTTHVSLAPQESRSIEIKISELRAQGINPGEISYLNFFLPNPRSNITLYFDDMRLVKGVEEARPEKRIAKEAEEPGLAGEVTFNDFETQRDLERFDRNDGLVTELSREHAAHSKHSLLAEYPAGAKYPGLCWEVYRRDQCLNWSKYEVFKFDVFNASTQHVVLNIKFKSKPNYPKPAWTTHISLAPNEGRVVEIKTADLIANGIDTKEISYLNFFMVSPLSDVILYFDHMRLVKGGSKETPLKKRTDAVEVKKRDVAYKVSIEPGLKKIFRESGSSRFRGINSVKIFMARNEYESFQIVVYGTQSDLKEVTIVTEDMVSGQGNRFKKENIEWKVVDYVKTKKPYYQVSHVGYWPDPLVKKEKIDVPKGGIQPIWVTLYAPKDIPSGTYKGKLTIKPSNAQETKMDLEIKIWDFTLPDEGHLKTAFDFYPGNLQKFYSRKRGEDYRNWQKRMDAITRKYYIAMLKYRISPIFNFDPQAPRFEDQIRLYSKYGLSNFAIGKYGGTFGNNWPKDDKALKKLTSLYKEYAKRLHKMGLIDKAYIYTWDEGKIGNPLVAKVAKMVHQADPGLKNMVCYHGMWDPTDNPEWGKDIDIWCFQIAHYDEVKRMALEKAGKEIWMYVSGPGGPYPNLAIDFPAIDPRIIPWMCWKYNIKGFLYWCVNYWTVDPWKDTFNTPWQQNGNGLLFYPGEDGPVSSIRLEVLRDGLEDYEYFYLLKRKVEQLRGQDNYRDFLQLVNEGERLLNINPSTIRSLAEYTKDPMKLYETRKRLGDLIEKINSICTTVAAVTESIENKTSKIKLLEKIIQEALKYSGGTEWIRNYKVDVTAVRGIVFLDSNSNAKYDAGEFPIAKVRVSDGYTVVRTDKDGSYALWAPREYVNVRITIPSGFWPTEVMRGWFKGVDLSSVDEVEVNFALQRKQWPEKIKFFHCSDLDGGHRVLKHYPKIAPQEPLFIEINDDLARAPFAHKWENPVIKPFTDRKIPIFLTPSNHDCESGKREIKDGVPPVGPDNYRWPHRLGKWQWLRQLGPIHYSVDIGGYHLIHIDNYASRIRDNKTIWPASGGWKGSGLPGELLLWLKEDLKYVPKEQPILFFGGNLANRKTLHRSIEYLQENIFKGRKVEVAFSGEVNCMRGTKATFCGAPIYNFGDRGKFFTLENQVDKFPGDELVTE